MEEEFKEAYQSYLDWIQKVREHRDVNKFQQGGQVDMQQAAQQIDQQAEQLLETMPQVKDQLDKMSDEDIYRLGESYIQKMGESKDENYNDICNLLSPNTNFSTPKLL